MNQGRIAITGELMLQFLREPTPDGLMACGDEIPDDARIVDSYTAGDCVYLVLESEKPMPTILTARYAKGRGPVPLEPVAA